MRKKKTIVLLAVGAFLAFSCNRKPAEQMYLDPTKDIDDRVENLVAQMTLEEKVSQMVYEAPAIERLGIPAYNWWNECLHGVGRAGKATVFPQAVGMAAAFDDNLMNKVATVISDEARAKYHEALRRGEHGIYQGLTYWTPNINIFRDPRWGRGMETYGEDPYLTSQLGIAFIKGLQGDDPDYLKLVATAKHFMVHSGPESVRHSFDVEVSERDFYDTYLPHFRNVVQKANVQSVMCAYNRYDGEACCGSGYLLNDLLRKQLGFNGYVVSDCWALVDFFKGHMVSENAVKASALALKSGTDLNCGSVFPNLVEAVKQGLITEEEIDVAVKRLFKARFQLGMFDPDSRVKYSQIPYSVVASKEHADVALEIARQSMVLLKNEGNVLPLDKSLKTIAVIGPNATDEEVLLANYNGHPADAVTPLRGIQEKVGKNTEILFARGCDVAPNLPYMTVVPTDYLFTDSSKSEHGFVAEYFDTTTFDRDPIARRIDSTVDFNWWEDAPIEGLPVDKFGVRWTGVLAPDQTGEYFLGGDGINGYRIFIDDEEIVDFYNRDMNLKKYKKVNLVAGHSYNIKIEYVNDERIAMMRFVWNTPVKNLEQEALSIASKADAVVMFMGLSPRLEGEEMDVAVEGFAGGDRISLDLPKTQVDLMKKIKLLNKPTVLVLLNGSAVSINWEKENIPAILEAWYPGQAAGTAIADILFGDYNPSGKLPVTFYKSVDDLPAFENYDMAGHTYRYFTKEPLFEFGYGLSYTTFEYSTPKIDKPVMGNEETAVVSVAITNSGKMAGDAVAQMYIKYPKSEIIRPIKDLKGFKRIRLNPGETETLTFEISQETISYMTPNGDVVEPGEYMIMIGSSSADKNLQSVALTVE